MKTQVAILSIVLLFGSSLSLNSKLRKSEPERPQAGDRPTVGSAEGETGAAGAKEEILPQVFFSNEQGKPGRDYVMFMTPTKEYITCKDGKMTAKGKEFSKDALFSVTKFDPTHIALKSINGGFIEMKKDKLKCKGKKIDEKNGKFEIVKKFDKIKVEDPKRAIALKINNNYLTSEGGKIKGAKELTEKSVLMAPHQTKDVEKLPAGKNKIEEYKKPAGGNPAY